MPDHFVIVGAQRSGTTYLYGLLDEHPEIEMAKPVRPEPKFFLDYDRYALGLDHVRGAAVLRRRPAGARARREEHELHRVGGRGATHRGDAAGRAGRRDRARPRPARAVQLPLQRAARRRVARPGRRRCNRGRAGDRSWDPEQFSVSPFDYLARGRYVEYLERFAAPCRAASSCTCSCSRSWWPTATSSRGSTSGSASIPTFAPSGLGTAVNESADDLGDARSRPSSRRWLRDYFREPNRRLAEYLGRPLPWPD